MGYEAVRQIDSRGRSSHSLTAFIFYRMAALRLISDAELEILIARKPTWIAADVVIADLTTLNNLARLRTPNAYDCHILAANRFEAWF